MATTKGLLTKETAKALGAGRFVALETVDFDDPKRPKTCLEVDFPIVNTNAIAALEASSGALKKPIYKMSKWWARRQSSVFRSMLIAAATKCPDDRAHAAKLVWDNYYANHQKKAAFKHLKVADIFMGGGTTLVEGARLGMQMSGNDLNPVAWFVTKQELAKVSVDEVKRLLADIEAEVKPQVMPFYYCHGLNDKKGTWTYKPSSTQMGPAFDPLKLTPNERKDYIYQGPEIIFTFWAKHGPCQVTGCGHFTPVMTNPIVAAKTLTVWYWEHACGKCGRSFHVEGAPIRMAPGVPLYVVPNEQPFSVIDPKRGVVCPHCAHAEIIKAGKRIRKSVKLALLADPEWLKGSPRTDDDHNSLGGSAQDDPSATGRWFKVRAQTSKLVEVRGELPEIVALPSGVAFATGRSGGSVPKRGYFTCAACGRQQDLVDSVRRSMKTAPVAPYAAQAFIPGGYNSMHHSGTRVFLTFTDLHARQLEHAAAEWAARKHGDLKGYWPESRIPEGLTTSVKDVLPNGHGYTHWWTLFNPRQLLALSLILKAIDTVGHYDARTREFVLGAFQQFVRCNTMLSIWHLKNNQISAALSNSNFNTKNTSAEPSVFGPVGDGSWRSAIAGLIDAIEWKKAPWELAVFDDTLRPGLSNGSDGARKSLKIPSSETLNDGAEISIASATDLGTIEPASVDLIITDPPFGGNIQYSELSDFFYVWIRCVLCKRYPEHFGSESTPRSLEAVTNSYREPENSDAFYKRLLTQCWREAYRILKAGGILSFTFHHSDDQPWVAVLESLFEAGFYLEATYPIRSDESKGDKAQFGSQKIEYDIIHVCRKRTEGSKPVSWARMRREVLQDVRRLQQLLHNHAKEGLPEADIQVIKRGKALEYFSRHYGKVYVDEGRSMSVKDALVGINQLIDETSGKGNEPPPVTAEPVTRQFLRIFDGTTIQARDQMQKFLRGSGMTPEEFEQRGWSKEDQKVFHVVQPLELARSWVGRHRRNMTSDYDQAMFLIGACYDGSGINAAETLKNENFRPHPALKALLDWQARRGAKQDVRNAASRALSIYHTWERSHQDQVKQLSFFEDN
jgi:hypothetical protein